MASFWNNPKGTKFRATQNCSWFTANMIKILSEVFFFLSSFSPLFFVALYFHPAHKRGFWGLFFFFQQFSSAKVLVEDLNSLKASPSDNHDFFYHLKNKAKKDWVIKGQEMRSAARLEGSPCRTGIFLAFPMGRCLVGLFGFVTTPGWSPFPLTFSFFNSFPCAFSLEKALKGWFLERLKELLVHLNPAVNVM